MLDLARVGELLGSFLGPAQTAEAAGPEALLAMIEAAGIDPQMLESLTQGEVAQVLAEHGINPAAFANGEIASLLSGLASGSIDASNVTDLLGALDGDRNG